LSGIDVELDKNQELKNGEQVNAKVTYNEEIAKELNIKVSNTEQTFTVEGLKETEKFDVNDYYNVNFLGNYPLAHFELEQKDITIIFHIFRNYIV
jgi:hypothetical protein